MRNQSSRLRARFRVLILAGDADGNLGDHAILKATCAALRAARPGVEITVVSDQPVRCRREFEAAAIPRGAAGFLRLIRVAHGSDLVLCGGGGLFQDDDSLVKMPYWALRTMLARLLAPRVVGYSLGVGPLEAGFSRLCARLAFACMERISVRDAKAQDVAQPLASLMVDIVPDPALSLAPAGRAEAHACLAAAGLQDDGRPLIGVAPRRWFPPRRRLVPQKLRARLGLRDDHGGTEGRSLVAVLAGALDELVERHGARIVFLPTYRLTHEADDRVAEEVSRTMRNGPAAVLRLDDAALYKAVCAELSLLIAGRMHPAILAAAAGTPVLPLAYNPKFAGLFALLGREEHVVPVAEPVGTADASALAGLAEEAWRAGPVERARIDALVARFTAFTRELVCAS